MNNAVFFSSVYVLPGWPVREPRAFIGSAEQSVEDLREFQLLHWSRSKGAAFVCDNGEPAAVFYSRVRQQGNAYGFSVNLFAQTSRVRLQEYNAHRAKEISKYGAICAI